MRVIPRSLKAIHGTAKCDVCGRGFYAGFYCDDNCFDTERIRGMKGQRYCPECLIRKRPVVIRSRCLTILPFGAYIRIARWLSRLLHIDYVKQRKWRGCEACLRMYREHRDEIYQ